MHSTSSGVRYLRLQVASSHWGVSGSFSRFAQNDGWRIGLTGAILVAPSGVEPDYFAQNGQFGQSAAAALCVNRLSMGPWLRRMCIAPLPPTANTCPPDDRGST